MPRIYVLCREGFVTEENTEIIIGQQKFDILKFSTDVEDFRMSNLIDQIKSPLFKTHFTWEPPLFWSGSLLFPVQYRNNGVV